MNNSTFVTKIIEENSNIVLLLTPELLSNLNLRDGQYLLWDLKDIDDGKITINIKFEEKQ